MSCLWISRGHFRVENETHWSADTQFLEDRKRHAWSRHPVGIVVVALLRMIAMNILAVARRLSRISYSNETPAWRQVAEHFFEDAVRQHPGDRGLRQRLRLPAPASASVTSCCPTTWVRLGSSTCAREAPWPGSAPGLQPWAGGRARSGVKSGAWTTDLDMVVRRRYMRFSIPLGP